MRKYILTIIILLFGLNLPAQNTIKDMVDRIEQIHNVKFVYESNLKIDISTKLQELKGASLESDLNLLFKNTDIIWSKKGEYITLKRAIYYNIGGVIRDAKSGETLVSVAIANQGDKAWSFTNGQGYFSIKVKEGEAVLESHHIGYQSAKKSLNIYRDTLITIEMQPLSMQMEEVVVTAVENLPEKMRIGKVNNLGAVSVNVNEMKYMPSPLGGQDIFKYLQVVPGVSSGTDGSSNLYIRGGTSDQTQILLDDVPIYNQSHAFGYISIFSAEAVKSTILHKGYTSPYYGGRLSGVVDMRMRDGNRNEHKQSFQLGLTALSANVEGPIANGRGSYLLSGRVFSLYPFLKLGYSFIDNKNKSGAPTFNFFDITGKITYDLNDKNTLSLSSYSGNDYFGVEFYSFEPTIDTEIDTDEIGKSISSMSWGNSVASLRLNSIINSKMFMNNTLYYSYLGNNVSSDYDYSIENREYRSNIKSRIDEFGYKNNFEYKVASSYSVDFGAHLSHQMFAPQEMSYQVDGSPERDGSFSDKSLSTYAIYLNNNFRVGNFELNFGARGVLFDNDSKVQYGIEPRLSLAYNVNNNLSIWGGYTKNNQALFSLNKHYLSIPIDYWAPYVNNKLQSADQYTIGIKYGTNKPLTLTGELYYKKTDNLTMVYDSDEFLLTGEGFDSGMGEAYGAEFMAQYNSRLFTLVGSYSYSKSDIIIDDNRRPYAYDTPHSANLLAMYKVKQSESKKHVLSLNLAFKTGRPFSVGNEIYKSANSQVINGEFDVIHYSKFSTIRLKDYFRADISYSMEKKLNKGSRIWQFSITNFTNYKNPYILLPKSDGDINQSDEWQFKMYTILPILPSFSYTRKF